MACPCISRDADIGIDRRSLIPPSQDLPAPGLTPLSTQPFSSDQLVFMDGTAKVGYGLILAGLLALAFRAGFHVALRRVRRRG